MGTPQLKQLNYRKSMQRFRNIQTFNRIFTGSAG